MANKDYIERLQQVIFHLRKADDKYVGSAPVHEVFQGETVWQGDVEVFDLNGHSRTKRAYAWSHLDGAKDERTRFVAVLEISPVASVETTVRVQIVKDVKAKMKSVCHE